MLTAEGALTPPSLQTCLLFLRFWASTFLVETTFLTSPQLHPRPQTPTDSSGQRLCPSPPPAPTHVFLGFTGPLHWGLCQPSAAPSPALNLPLLSVLFSASGTSISPASQAIKP